MAEKRRLEPPSEISDYLWILGLSSQKGTFSTKKSPAGAIRFCPGKQRCQDGVATSKVEIEILYRLIPFMLNVGNLGVKA